LLPLRVPLTQFFTVNSCILLNHWCNFMFKSTMFACIGIVSGGLINFVRYKKLMDMWLWKLENAGDWGLLRVSLSSASGQQMRLFQVGVGGCAASIIYSKIFAHSLNHHLENCFYNIFLYSVFFISQAHFIELFSSSIFG